MTVRSIVLATSVALQALIISAQAEGKKLPRHSSCLSAPLEDRIVVFMPFHAPEYPFMKYGPHPGVDFDAVVGTNVLAAANGVVVKAGRNRIGANVIDIRIRGGWIIRYGHLSHIAVRPGQKVLSGQRIGLSGGAVGAKGSGPLTTGPHLHFELRDRKRAIDPLPYLCEEAAQ